MTCITYKFSQRIIQLLAIHTYKLSNILVFVSVDWYGSLSHRHLSSPSSLHSDRHALRLLTPSWVLLASEIWRSIQAMGASVGPVQPAIPCPVAVGHLELAVAKRKGRPVSHVLTAQDDKQYRL